MTGTYSTDVMSTVERTSAMLARIAQHAESAEPIKHGSNGFVFIRIGIQYNHGDIEFPVLGYSKTRHEYVTAHTLIWGGDEYGFCWDSGTYYNESERDEAVAQFFSECDQVVYTAN